MSTSTLNGSEELSMQSFRALIGWLNDQDAIRHLLGRQPTPTDDLTKLQQIVTNCKAAVASRPAFSPTNPIIDVDDSMLKVVRARPEVQVSFAEFQEWYPAKIHLKDILAFQPIINVEGFDAGITTTKMSQEQLLEICLPASQPLPPSPSEVTIDPDGKGFSLSSLNPNLRIIKGGIGQALESVGPGLPGTQYLNLSLLVSLGTSYVNIAHYQGRYILRDGYHRVAGLLRQQIDTIPCIVINAQHPGQIGIQPGMLPLDLLLSERPPRVVDFWDDEVAHTVLRPTIRKVIRVRGDEFIVQG